MNDSIDLRVSHSIELLGAFKRTVADFTKREEAILRDTRNRGYQLNRKHHEASAALEKWKLEERPAIAEYTYLAPKTEHFHPETGHSVPNFSYAYVAQAVEVEVDTETGAIKLLKVVSADDVGKAINPALVQGQIEGGVVQAQGYAVLENMKVRNGRILTDQFSTYLIPTILDIPDTVESVIVEVAEPNGPFGARGLGELPFLPLAPAIAAAVHDATGVWFNEFPLTPEAVLRGLGKI